MHLYHSNFMKPFRAIHAEINKLFSKIFAQGSNRNESKQDTTPSNLEQASTYTNKGGNAQEQARISNTSQGGRKNTKKGQLISKPILKKKPK